MSSAGTQNVDIGAEAAEQAGGRFIFQDFALKDETRFGGCNNPTLWSYAAPVVSEVTVGGRRNARRVYHSGDMRLTCPGVDVVRTTDEPAVIRGVSIDENAFVDLLGVAPGALERRLEPLQRYPFRSTLVESAIASLKKAAADQSPVGKLYTDTVLNVIVIEMWRLSGNEQIGAQAPTRKLSSQQVRMIDQFIADNLLAKVDAAALAQLLDMPAAVFAGLFKETTGKTPYQYVLARRIANARCMIERSPLSLAEIAYRNGFSSQSHMTDVFKAKIGATPGALRRA